MIDIQFYPFKHQKGSGLLILIPAIRHPESVKGKIKIRRGSIKEDLYGELLTNHILKRENSVLGHLYLKYFEKSLLHLLRQTKVKPTIKNVPDVIKMPDIPPDNKTSDLQNTAWEYTKKVHKMEKDYYAYDPRNITQSKLRSIRNDTNNNAKRLEKIINKINRIRPFKPNLSTLSNDVITLIAQKTYLSDKHVNLLQKLYNTNDFRAQIIATESLLVLLEIAFTEDNRDLKNEYYPYYLSVTEKIVIWISEIYPTAISEVRRTYRIFSKTRKFNFIKRNSLVERFFMDLPKVDAIYN